MGTESSTNPPNKEINQNKVQRDYQQDAKEAESKICNEIQKEIENDNKLLEKKLNEVQESIQKNNSVPNLVDNFAKLRTIMPPNVGALGDFMEKMKDGWIGIMAQLDQIRECGDVGYEKAKIMEEIHLDYWRLLLKTRSKIQLIMTRCKIQKLNITRLLSILQDGHNPKTTLTADDILAYHDCMNCLLMWLKSDNVQNIIEEWKKMSERLLKEQQDWRSLAKAIGRSVWDQILSCMQVVAAGACIVIAVFAVLSVITIATEGTAVGATIVSTTDVMSGRMRDIVESSSIAVAIYIGESIMNGANLVKNYFYQTATLYNIAAKMQERLEILLKQSLKMEEKLKAADDACLNACDQVDFMKDLKSFQMMECALKDLVGYLDEYMNQGQKVMQTIQESAEKFIDV